MIKQLVYLESFLLVIIEANMTKKQTRMKKYLTSILILFIIAIFLVVTVVAIIFTQGGKITKDGIINTGSIKLEISPENLDVNIYLDDKKVEPKSHYINSIEPGEHSLRVEGTSFHAWEKKITIRESLVSNIEVKLFPLEAELLQLTKTDIDKVFFSEDGSYAYYLVTNTALQPQDRGFWKLRLEDQDIFFRRTTVPEKIADINSEISNILSENDFSVNSDSNNKQLLISTKDQQRQYLIDLGQNSTDIVISDLTELLGFTPSYVNWFNNNNSLIVANDEIVFEYNLINHEKTIIDYTTEQPIFTSNSTIVYIYSPSDHILSTYQNKQIKRDDTLSALLPSNIEKIWVSQDSNSLVVSTDSTFHLLDIATKQIITLVKDAELLEMSFNGRTILFDSNGEISTVTIDKIIADNKVSSKINPLNISKDITPRFINNANLIAYNNKPVGKLQVSEDDGSNIIDVLDNSQIINGYFHFQKSGTSLVALLEEDNEGNVLKNNLYKLSLNKGGLPFQL